MKSTDVKALWQAEGRGSVPPALEQVQDRADAFYRKITRRNWIEYAASALVVAAFAVQGWSEESRLVRLGCLLVIAGTIYVVWQLHRRASLEQAPIAPTVVQSVAYLRTQLRRQRDALRTVWKWYLLPFLPGLVLVMAGRWIAPQGESSPGLIGILGTLGLVLILFGAIWWANHRAADKLQQEIDALDAIREEME